MFEVQKRATTGDRRFVMLNTRGTIRVMYSGKVAVLGH